MKRQVQLVNGVMSAAPETQVPGGDFDNDGQVPSGFDRHCLMGDGYTHDFADIRQHIVRNRSQYSLITPDLLTPWQHS